MPKRQGMNLSVWAASDHLNEASRIVKKEHLSLTEMGFLFKKARQCGITEGFHRKMKLIQRRAYGFANVENYRLRVIAQCS